MAVRVTIVIAILQLYRVLLVRLMLLVMLVMLRRVAEGVLLGDWRDGQAVMLLVVVVDGDSSITGSTTGAVDVGMRRIVVARRRREARHDFVRLRWLSNSSAARLSVQSRENAVVVSAESWRRGGGKRGAAVRVEGKPWTIRTTKEPVNRISRQCESVSGGNI
jgi:hypothetical protein